MDEGLEEIDDEKVRVWVVPHPSYAGRLALIKYWSFRNALGLCQCFFCRPQA